MKERIITFFKKGSSEALAFAYIAPLICFLIIEACAYVSLNSNAHEIMLALDSAGRGACICTNYNDAVSRAQMIAESSIHSSDISNVNINIEYATADDEWQAGLLLRITITADVNSLSILFNPSFSTEQRFRTVSKTMIYTVEGVGINADDLTVVAAVIMHEDGSSHSGMIACGTALLNRRDSANYPNDWYELLTTPGQFEDYQGILNLINNPDIISDEAYSCARTVLSGGRDARLMSPPNSLCHNQGPCCSWYGNAYNETEGTWTVSESSAEATIVIGNQHYHWKW